MTLIPDSKCFFVLLDFTEPKQDVVGAPLGLVQQRANQLALCCEVKGHRASELGSGKPRQQGE